MQCLLHEEKKPLVSCMHCDMKYLRSIISHCDFVVVKMKQQKRKNVAGVEQVQELRKIMENVTLLDICCATQM